MDFISQNGTWMWVVAAVLSGAFLFLPRLNGGRNRANMIRPQDAVTMINRDKAQVVDVRSQSQFEAGHIVNSKHVPIESFYVQGEINGLPKNRSIPIILVCDAGNLSFRAEKPLKKLGYEKVFSMGGGLKNWVNMSFPLESSPVDEKTKAKPKDKSKKS